MIIICKKLIDLTPFLKIESDVTLNLNPEPDADEIALFRILVENTMMSEQTCFSRKYTRAHGFDVSPWFSGFPNSKLTAPHRQLNN